MWAWTRPSRSLPTGDRDIAIAWALPGVLLLALAAWPAFEKPRTGPAAACGIGAATTGVGVGATTRWSSCGPATPSVVLATPNAGLTQPKADC